MLGIRKEVIDIYDRIEFKDSIESRSNQINNVQL